MLGFRLFWITLLTGLLIFSHASSAVESSGLGAYPTGQAGSMAPWFQYHLAPGQATIGSTTIDNRTQKTQDLLLYPVDAAPNGDGGFGMAPSYLRPNDAGQWLKLDATHIRLAPGVAQQVGFSFHVPAHAAVGPHYAGIVIQPVRPSASTSSGFGLQVISRLGVRLYETVPGSQRPRLDITALRHQVLANRISFPTTLHNSGNTILTPAGWLKVYNELGSTVAISKFNLGGEIKPDQATATTVTTTLPSSWLPRRHHAILALTYGTTPHLLTTERAITFWTGYPLVWLSIILLAMLGGISTVHRLIRHT